MEIVRLLLHVAALVALVCGDAFIYQDGSDIVIDGGDKSVTFQAQGSILFNGVAFKDVVARTESASRVQDYAFILGGNRDQEVQPGGIVDLFDHTVQRWTASSSVMNIGRQYPAAAVVGSSIFVFGGGILTGEPKSPLACTSTVEAFFLENSTWTLPNVSPAPLARMRHAAVALAGGVYLLGGSLADVSQDLSDVEIFFPLNNTVAPRASMLTARQQFGAVALLGRIYVFGGFASFQGLNSSEVYYPANNTWAYVRPLPFASSTLVRAVAMGGLAYIVSDNTTPYSYNPVTNSYTALPQLQTSFSDFSLTLIDGCIHVFASSAAAVRHCPGGLFLWTTARGPPASHSSAVAVTARA